MKIDRLIGILSVLLQKEKTTAPELAERFEVSRRTINRDIEDLCRAGIPIRTSQGTGGGISIMDGYRMDRTILTSKEDSILIDLSSWYKESLTPKIETIQDAIGERHLVRFRYYSPTGESGRTVEPYYLVFHWSSWYLWGWCRDRKDFRLFKLNRMDGVQKTEEHFVCREAPMPDLSNEKIFPDKIKVRALFDLDQKWRLVEDFGPECFVESDDGRLLFTTGHTDMESLITWLMTFGDKAEVLEPEEAREAIAQMAKRMAMLYKDQ